MSKAPSLLDPAFVYVPSVETDIRKTFERIRRMQNNDAGVTGKAISGQAHSPVSAEVPASPFARKEGK